MSAEDKFIASYNQNNNFEDSIGGFDLVGTGVTFAPGKFDEAGDYDGIDDYAKAELPAAFKTPKVTYHTWVYLNAAPTSGMALMTGEPKGTSADGRGLRLLIKSDGVARIIKGSGDGSFEFIDATTVLAPLTFHQLIATYDEDFLRIFVNGRYEGELTDDTGIEWNDRVGSFGPDPAQFYLSGLRNDTPGTIPNAQLFEGRLDVSAISDQAITFGGVDVGDMAGGDVEELWNGGAGIPIGIGKEILAGNAKRFEHIIDVNRKTHMMDVKRHLHEIDVKRRTAKNG